MALLGFSAPLVPAVEDGTKPHTIRDRRIHPVKSGEMLHLYTGLRTKSARLLFRTPCTRVQRIELSRGEVLIDGFRLDNDDLEGLARRDGFPDRLAFWKFFEHRLPFAGQLIWWDPAVRLQ